MYRFALPIGTTVVLLPIVTVSVIFLMQLEGKTPSCWDLIVMGVILNFVAVGSSGIPQDNLILIFMVIPFFGISNKHIAKVIAVEWFIDR